MKKGMIVAGIICLMLTGCGKKGNVEDDFANIQGTSTTTEEPKGEAERKVNYTVDGAKTGIEMKVNAVVDTRIPEQVVTQKLKKVVVDDDYLVSMAKKIFDQGEYEVLPPTGCKISDIDSTMSDILASLEEKSSEYGGSFEPSAYYGNLMNVQLSMDEGNEVSDEYPTDQVIVTEVYDDLYSKGSTSYAYVKGNIDGKPYIMEYTKYENASNDQEITNAGDIESIQIYPLDGHQMRWGYIEAESETNDYSENAVNYNDALSQAENCISQLEFEKYSLTRVYDALVNTSATGVVNRYENTSLEGNSFTGGDALDDTAKVSKNGYRFIFTPGIDGMQLAYCAGTERTTMQYDNMWESKDFWMQPVVQIDVDATGIRNIKMNSIYEFEEELSNDSKLLSFEQADDEAKQAFEASYEENCDVTDIRLEYVLAQYEKESAMVPAWVYYYRSYGPVEESALFAVNALDGSVIHFRMDYSNFSCER